MSADYWYRLHFKLRLYEADGQSFQRLASDILHASFPGFVAVAPSGALGDGGNDGFVPQEQHYFQVYGPQAASSQRPAWAVRKAVADFEKLRRNYPGIQRYSFVYNDRYQGVPRNVLDALAKMQTQTGIACRIVASRHLTDWFMNLSEDRRAGIIAGVPTALPEWIDPRALGEVVAHLALHDTSWDGMSRRIAPDFDKKIQFNGLNGFAAARLRSMSYQAGSVDAFFETRDAHLAQAVAQELRELYDRSRQQVKVKSGDEDAAALRYIWMIDRMIPPIAPKDAVTLKAYRQAAEVVMAKYFESCDVYEEP